MTPEDFDPEQLARGMRVEREHVNDDEIATEIAMDHLVEDPRYYEKLAKMEMRENPPMSKDWQNAYDYYRQLGYSPEEAAYEASEEQEPADVPGWDPEGIVIPGELNANASAFYVFEMRGDEPIRQVNRKPLTLKKAKPLARIGASKGKHARVVTSDPRKDDFRIVARYEAGG